MVLLGRGLTHLLVYMLHRQTKYKPQRGRECPLPLVGAYRGNSATHHTPFTPTSLLGPSPTPRPQYATLAVSGPQRRERNQGGYITTPKRGMRQIGYNPAHSFLGNPTSPCKQPIGPATPFNPPLLPPLTNPLSPFKKTHCGQNFSYPTPYPGEKGRPSQASILALTMHCLHNIGSIIFEGISL